MLFVVIIKCDAYLISLYLLLYLLCIEGLLIFFADFVSYHITEGIFQLNLFFGRVFGVTYVHYHIICD